jgi:hypothetical protein
MYHIDIASGSDLDLLANLYGIVRKEGETDSALRDRQLKTIKEISQPKEPVCECGAHSVGIIHRGKGHSDWCPLY